MRTLKKKKKKKKKKDKEWKGGTNLLFHICP
jgi:hypothetical protein